MDLRQIKNLMKEFEDSKIHKLEIKDNEFSILLEKENSKFVSSPSFAPVGSFTETTTVKEQGHSVKEEEVNENTLVRSPLVGTFYQAPSPDSEVFAKVNQKVNVGDVLFIVEAMKVMNEITSPVNGTVVSINVKDATMVEFDQIVMEIKE
ncbi:MAG: Biotin carboxyl carrier protein of acetyl-CoA carboxylase [Candidatus Izimaplasma bacterium HR2]|nr:MAG: Biotin carboxyl carrier protein of acetyl-CoA carboxylase [Candidatus Izimaplasma bacterium HR2]